MAKTYDIFISHSWTYGDHYERLIEFFDEDPYFHYRNYSVPKDDPIHDAPNQTALYEAIKKQIAPVNVVIILAGVYASYSKWIDKEIRIAGREFYQKKPILAVQPWGSERTSQVVKDVAGEIVGWNSSSIISGIREMAL